MTHPCHMDTQSPKTEKMPENAMNIIKLLKKRLLRLKDVLQRRNNGVLCLPLSVFIDYTEELPAEQNGHALAIKTMLFDLFNGKISEDEHARLRQLGRKPTTSQETTIIVQGALNDIHNNDYVKAGIQ